ncbi:LamG domain-containing protein [Verrucomicrobiota bacterium]
MKRALLIALVICVILVEQTSAATKSPSKGPSASVVLYYTFDKNDGKAAVDVSRKKHDGTIHGAKWTEEGKIGGGLSFDGEDDVVEVPSFDPGRDIRKGRSFSISVWVFPNKDTSKQAIVHHPGRLYLLNEGNYAWRAGWGNQHTALVRLPTPPVDRWNHLVVVCDARRHEIRIYQDAVWVNTHEYTGNEAFRDGMLTIGGVANGAHFNGILDEVMIWKKALSGKDIEEMYDSKK